MPRPVTCSCGRPVSAHEVALLHTAAVATTVKRGQPPASVLTLCDDCGAAFGLILGDDGYNLLQLPEPGVLAHKHTNSVN